MGAVIKKNPKKENLDNNTQQKLRKHKKSILRIVESPIPGIAPKQMNYSEDVNEIVNLAFAIQRQEFIENIELFIAVEKLPKTDFMSLSDPMVVCYHWKNDDWVKLGITEVAPESLSYKFLKSFLITFSTDKKLRFEVYDVDNFDNLEFLEKQELIGYIECEISEIKKEINHTITKPIINPKRKNKKLGALTVRGMSYDVTNTKYEFSFSAYDFVSKGEIFLKFNNLLNDVKEFVPFFVTNTEKNSKKGIVWPPFSISSSKFSDENATIKIDVMEFIKSKGNILIAEVEISLHNLIDTSVEKSKSRNDEDENEGYSTKVSKLEIKRNGLSVGYLKYKVQKIVKLTFLDYIFAGSEVSLIIGIDFSKSNKDPDDPSSLHYINESFQDTNPYINALKDLIGFLQYYDHDNTIPVYGFGAKMLPYHDIVSQCFACNKDYFNPDIIGIDEIIENYKKVVKEVKFHGPSAINELVKLAIEYAKDEKLDQFNQKYYILLIFTDGNLNFISEAKAEINEASEYPISIFIVGVANTESQRLKDLDNFQSKKNRERDIVQYVNYQKYRYDPEILAKETLAEFPNQFLEIMERKKIPPIKKIMHLNAASNEFMTTSIEKLKQNKKIEKKIESRPFLINKKKQLLNSLANLNYEKEYIKQIMDKKILIPAFDVNLAEQIIANLKNIKKKSKKLDTKASHIYKPVSITLTDELKSKIYEGLGLKHRFLKVKNKAAFENVAKEKMKLEKYERTKKFLEKIEKRECKNSKNLITNFYTQNINNKDNIINNLSTNNNQIQKKYYNEVHYQSKIIRKVFEESNSLRNLSNEEHLCLICQSEKIVVIFSPCGHAALCLSCFHEEDNQQYCLICKIFIESHAVFGNKEEKGEDNFEKVKEENLIIKEINDNISCADSIENKDPLILTTQEDKNEQLTIQDYLINKENTVSSQSSFISEEMQFEYMGYD